MIGAVSALSKELVMVEVGPSSEENDPSTAETQVRHDFSIVQGFQVVGAEDHGRRQRRPIKLGATL